MDQTLGRETVKIPAGSMEAYVEERIREVFSSDYTNIRRLGSGGSGLVFTGDHKRLPRRDVIKYMKRPKGDPELDHREADIMAITKATGLPTVYNYVTQGDDIFIVMEYMQGRSFESVLKGNYAVPQSDAVRYTIDLLESLKELHSKNIIHGDINPRNVILNSERDSAALIDFDISGYLSGGRVIVAGYSSYYAAPEQIKAFYALQRAAGIHKSAGQADQGDLPRTEKITITGDGSVCTIQAESQSMTISGDFEESPVTMGMDQEDMTLGADLDPVTLGSGDDSMTLGDGAFESLQEEYQSYAIDRRADLYSVGAFLYRLLTGRPPQERPEERKPLSAFGHFSDSVEAIVNKALSMDPAERFQDAGEMQAALADYVTSDSRFRALERTHRILRILMVLGIAGCLTLAYLGFMRMGRERMDAYNAVVARMETDRENGDERALTADLEEALSLQPDLLAAQVEMARYYYQEGRYEEGVTYILNDALKNGQALGSDSDKGKLFYILACCYLEQENYLEAQTYYGKAIGLDDTNPDYYRDYAISLARTESAQEAQKQLDIAIEKGLLEDQIALVRGEIKVARHEYEDSLADFDYCIDHTDQPYALMSAYLMKSKAWFYMGTDEEHLLQAAQVLEEGRARVADNYQRYILEQLSYYYIYLNNLTGDTSYCSKAIAVLQELVNRGYTSFNTAANLFYENMRLDDRGEARNWALYMEEKYPERYEPYMFLAWLEALDQDGLSWDNKDYSAFFEYYDKAREIYDTLPDSEQTDQQMENLEQARLEILEQMNR